MLKPEQIAEFNARAEAGERPVLEWAPDEEDQGRDGIYTYYTCEVPGLSVEQPGATRAAKPATVVFGSCPSEELDNETAAQLAAERLLREATAPLHADIDAIRDAVVNGRLQLSEIDIDWQTINAVLAIIDDHTPPKKGV